VRLLVKNLGKRMPDSIVREGLDVLNIRVKKAMQLRFGPRDQNPAKECPPPHFIVSVTRRQGVSRVRALTELCGLRVTE
jgi:hypothetical protein